MTSVAVAALGNGGAPATPVANRFFNASLEPFYRSCLLPARWSGRVPAHALRSTCYERRDDDRSGFLQRDFVPPPRRCRSPGAPRPAEPFAPPPPAPDDGAEPAAKKQKRRKRELVGQLRTYRVRMIPTTEQRRELRRCFSAARHAYNWTVAQVEKHDARPNFYDLRKAYRESDTQPAWAAPVATRIVAGAVEEATNAYKSNIAKRQKNPGQHGAFHVHFRSHKKTQHEVIRIEGKGENGTSPLLALKPVPVANNAALRDECLAFFGSNLKSVGGIRLQDKPHVIARLRTEGPKGQGDGVINTCRIQYDKRSDSFHFLYVYELAPLPDPDPSFKTKRVVATDPGVRSFQTWYSPTSGRYGELFVDGRDALEARCRAIDARTSLVAQRGERYAEVARDRRRRQRQGTFRRMKRKLAKERRRLTRWMEAGHYAAANHLLRSHELVIAPTLRVAEMVPKDGRVFGCKTARAMLTWSHGRFERRLEAAAYRHPGRHVIVDSGEPGTSKTCTNCGHWNAGLGASRIFECAVCGVHVNRDVAGARNNFFAAYGRAMGVGWDRVER